MSLKHSPSIRLRFTGPSGRKNLCTALCLQKVVAGDRTLAQKLIDYGRLCEYPVDKDITRQGDTDNEIFFIVSGSVNVLVNQREIAVRSSGNHVGEMALLDPTARRSATVRAREKTMVLKVSEQNVTKIAQQFPELWRRIAIEIATRLRERAKFIREPSSAPSVFIGSSKEALSEATYLGRILSRCGAVPKLWTSGVFQLSQTAIEDLVRASSATDFAILFLTPDDLTSSRGKRLASPRDNIVFELGLFMGAIGRERTYCVVPQAIALKLPTNLLGLTQARYERGNRRSIGRRLREVSRLVTTRIKDLGSR